MNEVFLVQPLILNEFLKTLISDTTIFLKRFVEIKILEKDIISSDLLLTKNNQLDKKKVKDLSDKLNFKILIIISNDGDLYFVDQNLNKFNIDFINDKQNYFKAKLSIKNEPLSKALGAGEKGLRVIDFTAGLGIDSVFLAQLGFYVTAIERNPIIFLALESARKKAQVMFPELYVQYSLNNINFIFSESLNYYNQHVLEPSRLKNLQLFDVAYFDPMFPEKKKSALPRQEMVFFKKLVGEDLDAEAFVQKVIHEKVFQRLVVKRPVAASQFCKPQGSVVGKIIRFDIYSH